MLPPDEEDGMGRSGKPAEFRRRVLELINPSERSWSPTCHGQEGRLRVREIPDNPFEVTDIFLLSASSADDSSLLEQVCQLVNRAYTVAEAGMWRTAVERTTRAEVATAMRDRELAVAYEEDGRLVGAIRSRLVDEHTGWFGALAVDGAHGGRGVGGQLVRFVEEQTRSAGATMMRLEVLVPLTPHPHTERLAAWYARMGYREAGRCSLVEVDPPAVAYAAVPIEVSVMEKHLVVSGNHQGAG